MSYEVEISELKTSEVHIEKLSDLLIKTVEGGASIGFLPPMSHSQATEYWENVLEPNVILLIAKVNHEIVGSVQLQLCGKQNGRHRAEIAKLITHPDYRRKGIARLLMQKAEERAKQEKRSLLVLDTREGDVSNQLYISLGFTECGRIPLFAESADGKLDATIVYYKTC
ncbi:MULTISPECIES: GNAT family N-acetyltransferase [Metabacillus]|uniref:GNAT family N-acetyltransferase n=1 Tax=Metabacillus hrfriensis TaxID=3048891 RepID=A0ACD4R6A6_9BACI|nr:MULTISPECIES: GNAT family N-acetyltransferase [Metabacillus]UAL50513.1 GNAT family N-acetyltransferase [Metabacillus dongyingensis]USK26772.1 GNAT family N-acetyltransferase [Bacillus sp. CMF21]WHZ55993.1 GNAT family N-acetyltransferase [Metabacillus sp. CT-WN-B3]